MKQNKQNRQTATAQASAFAFRYGAPYAQTHTSRQDPLHTVRVMLLGSGELGKEIALELMRLGARVCALDSYEHAPAMQTAHDCIVLDMTDPQALKEAIDQVQPDIIVPEVEAIATDVLTEAVAEGIQVVPSAKIAQICMNRERLRTLAHDGLGLPTTPYRFASNPDELKAGAQAVGYPCVVKPIMSSSGHGQSIMRSAADLDSSWQAAQLGRRAAHEGQVSRVIVEALAPLDYELTIITVSSCAGVVTCSPIGHRQVDGDYRESWQPAAVPESVLHKGNKIARRMVERLAAEASRSHEHGWGVFGVELFVLRDGQVLFNEVSPRPHDTGMVTMISQHLSEFALHARAILGIPVTEESLELIHPDQVSASRALVIEGKGQVAFSNVSTALAKPHSDLRIFCKPSVNGRRRMGVALAYAPTEEEARKATQQIEDSLTYDLF